MNVQLEPASTANVDTVATAASASVARRRRAALIAGSIMIVVVAAIVYSIYRDSTLYATTDNARLSGQLIQIGSLNGSRIDSVNVTVGRPVRRYAEFVLNQAALLAQGSASILVGVLLITTGLVLLYMDHAAEERAPRRRQGANQAPEFFPPKHKGEPDPLVSPQPGGD